VTPVRYHEAAEDELLDEIGYLELQAKGLGQRFFAEVRRTENLIASSRNLLRRSDRGSGNTYFESSGTH